MSELTIICGSEDKPEYAVISRSGRCVAAIRPFISGTQNKVLIGLRVRVCAGPEVTDNSMTATEIAKAYPKTPMPNVDNKRGSFMVSSLGKIKNFKNVVDELTVATADKKFLQTMITTVKDTLAVSELEHPDKQLMDWMSSRWDRIIQKLGGTVHKIDEEDTIGKVNLFLAALSSHLNEKTKEPDAGTATEQQPDDKPT